MAQTKSMKTIRKLIGWVIFISLVGGPAAYFYTRESVIDVTAITLTKGRIEQTIAAFSSGTVEPKQSSMVAAETLGKVIAIPVKEGDRVNAGDVLVVLNGEQQDFQVTQAETRMNQAETALKALKQQYENDQSRILTLKRTRDISAQEFNKDKTLYEKGDVGSESMVNLSEVKFLQIEDTYKSLNDLLGLYPLRIEEAEKGMESISIMVEQAKISRDWAQVKAPFAGLVADILVEVGESVGGGFGGGGGGGMLGGGMGAGVGAGAAGLPLGGGGMSMGSPMAVAKLVDDSDLYVKAPFDESTYGKIKVDQQVRIMVDAYPDEEFPGRVSTISSTVNTNMDRSRTFVVEILIEQGKERLVPGMSADAIIVADAKEDVLSVPTEALVREEEGYVIKDGRAVRRSVTVGIGNWQAKEVVDGLREGERLITSVGIKELKDGVKVNVVDSLEEK
jgi:HlyD family secretion protein